MTESTIRDVRRRQILDAARSLVAAGGLAALTFGSLERRLTFTRGVITHHFASKSEIAHALLDDVVSDIDAATTDATPRGGSTADQVFGLLKGMVEGLHENPEATRVLIAFWSLQQVDSQVALTNAALFSRQRSQCAGVFRAGQTRGEVRPDLDVEAISAVVIGLVIGVVAQAVFDRAAVNVEHAVTSAAEAIILAVC